MSHRRNRLLALGTAMLATVALTTAMSASAVAKPVTAAAMATGNTSTSTTNAAGKPLPSATGRHASGVASDKQATALKQVASNDCPPGTMCKVVPAALADNGCNYSPAYRTPDNSPTAEQVLGITEHTTEGNDQAALKEAQDTDNCVSWNYLVGSDGTIYVSVPVKDIAYDADNWYFNTNYIQIEQVGYAENCASIGPAEYQASVKLDRYLIQRFGIKPSPATIFGHDSVPGTSDSVQATQHWDPGVCWPWDKFLADVGAPIRPSAGADSRVVTIDPPLQRNHQPTENCPGAAFTDCQPAAQPQTNFLALHTVPSVSSPLLSDPYLHPDGSAGSDAMQDWGDKAVTGHSYYVFKRISGWTGIWYGGQKAWFQDDEHVTVGATAQIVTAASDKPVTIYGRPLPEDSAGGFYYDGTKRVKLDHGWCSATQTPVAGTSQDCIPASLKPAAAVLTKYSLKPGQYYTVAEVSAPDYYAEGCDNSTCTYAGDNVVVVGKTKYVEIDFNHRYAFVRVSDVKLSCLRSS